MDPELLQEMQGISPVPLEDLLNIEISGWSIAAALIFSTVGIWLFRVGRKRHNKQLTYISIALMFYSYFVPGPLTNWTIGIALCVWAKMVWPNENL